MFSKETYVNRRAELKRLVKSGVIVLFGNNNSPSNYPNNGYSPFRPLRSCIISDRTGTGSWASSTSTTTSRHSSVMTSR